MLSNLEIIKNAIRHSAQVGAAHGGAAMMRGDRVEKFTIYIQNTGESFVCLEGQSVLRAMEVFGRKGIPVGCRGGGCGVCKINVSEGHYRTTRMSRACVSAEEERAGTVLACKLFPASDLTVEVLGCMGRALTAGTPCTRPGATENGSDDGKREVRD